jgi:hypothetical protein
MATKYRKRSTSDQERPHLHRWPPGQPAIRKGHRITAPRQSIREPFSFAWSVPSESSTGHTFTTATRHRKRSTSDQERPHLHRWPPGSTSDQEGIRKGPRATAPRQSVREPFSFTWSVPSGSRKGHTSTDGHRVNQGSGSDKEPPRDHNSQVVSTGAVLLRLERTKWIERRPQRAHQVEPLITSFLLSTTAPGTTATRHRKRSTRDQEGPQDHSSQAINTGAVLLRLERTKWIEQRPQLDRWPPGSTKDHSQRTRYRKR